MKRYIMFVIMFASLVILSGCSNYNQAKKENIKEKEKSKYEKIEWKCDVSLYDIADISGFDNMNDYTYMFVTKEGYFYLYSTDKLYSNEEHCKKIEYKEKFKKFINGALITENDNILAYNNNSFIPEMRSWTGAFNYDWFKKDNSLFIFAHHNNLGFDISGIQYCGFVSGNKIKIIDTMSGKLDSTTELKEGEKFIGGYYNIFKTSKAYYYNEIINREECDKYADVECKYGVKEISDINSEFDKIYFFNGKVIIYEDDANNIYLYSRF